MRSLFAVIAGATLMLGVSACSEATTKPQPESIETAVFAPSLGVDLAASTKTLEGAYVRDITPGTGVAIGTQDSVAVRYTLYFKDGTIVDTNEDGGKPLFEFKMGTSYTIRGFEIGLRGMKVGGRRQILVPPALGYPNGPLAGKILIFNVTMVAKRDLAN